MKDVMIAKSDKGEMSVFDGRDDFVACFRDGKWTSELIFQAHEEEEFTIIENEDEINRILTDARKSLNQPFAEETKRA